MFNISMPEGEPQITPENLDNNQEIGQNMPNQEGVHEQGPEHLDFIKKGLEKEAEMVEKTKGKARLLAAFALASSLFAASPAHSDASRFFEALVRSTERVLTTGMREQGRTERDVLKNERDIRREELRKEENIYRETERTKQRLGSDEIRKERDIGTAEVRAAERTGTFIPRRGGSVETEKTPTGARSTVRPDSESYYERTERERGIQRAQEDYRELKRPTGFLDSYSSSFQRAYKEEWRNLTGEVL